MSTTQAGVIKQFVDGLKSRSDETRNQTIKDLRKYVSSELGEVSRGELQSFLDLFNSYLSDMVGGADINERKGAIIAIGEEKTFPSLSN